MTCKRKTAQDVDSFNCGYDVEMANSSDVQVNLALCFISPEFFENFKLSVMGFH